MPLIDRRLRLHGGAAAGLEQQKLWQLQPATARAVSGYMRLLQGSEDEVAADVFACWAARRAVARGLKQQHWWLLESAILQAVEAAAAGLYRNGIGDNCSQSRVQ